jgi:hypothetical protein
MNICSSISFLLDLERKIPEKGDVSFFVRGG